jgi:hypothetical protein
MVEEEKNTGTRGLQAKTVRHFHSVFRAYDERTRKAAMMRVSRWWKAKLDDGLSNKILTRRTRDGRKQMHAKALRGRGRKRADWVIALYSDLHDAFHMLRRLGVKMSASVLKHVAHQLLKQADNDSIYGTGLLDPVNKKCITICVNSSWVERFQVAHGLTVRRSTGKGMLSPDKTKEMPRTVARYLGELKRQFDSRLLDEAAFENGDETHVMVNMDNGRCLAAIGDADVKYADVVSGGMRMTLRQTFPWSSLRHHARLRYLPVRRCLSYQRSRGNRAWCLVSSWPTRMDGSQGNGRVLWRKSFGRWRKEINGFCTWITVEDIIRQQILRKPSVRSGRPCDISLRIVLT